MRPEFIRPDWPAPATVHALSTTRVGGVSAPPWDSFNLGDHVGDDPAHVARNRRILRMQAELPRAPRWLEQVHGCHVRQVEGDSCRADAGFTRQPGEVCVVMTADCLPVLFCNTRGTAVAAAHAGWRGLAGGILEATVEAFREPASSLMAWLGPAIGPGAFEVGGEVREAFVSRQSDAARAFRRGDGNKWYADIWLLARLRLQAAGVHHIHGGGRCTFEEAETFFSYRRDGQTGRMASLIWLER